MIMSSLVNAKNADGKANPWEQHTKQGKAGESWLIVWGFFLQNFSSSTRWSVYMPIGAVEELLYFFSDFSEFYLPLGFL